MRGSWPFFRWVLFLGVAALALSPALRVLANYSHNYDWRYFETMLEMSRRTVVWYGQLPLWNPYSCGGEVDLANPQALEAAPTFVLNLLFGTAAGIKLSLVFYYCAAIHGAYRLSRHLGATEIGALLSGFGFGLSGYLALHLSSGHINFAGVALYPYLVLFYEKAVNEREWVIPLGAVAAWIALLGGTFTPPMSGVLLVLWAGLRAIEGRSLRPLWPLLPAVFVALLVSAVRMLPVLEFIKDHPRPLFRRTPDVSPPWYVLWDLVAWRELAPLVGRRYWSHEYTARLPYVLVPFFVLPLFFYRKMASSERRLFGRLYVFTLLAGLLSMGNFSPLAPWSLLQKLPVLRDLRVPSRHEVLLTLSLPIIAGLCWDLLQRQVQGRSLRGLGIGLVALCAFDGVLFTAWNFRNTFPVTILSPKGPVPFYHIEGHWRTMREDLFAGHGSLGCDEEAPLQRAEALDVGDVPQARLLDPSSGEVLDVGFSPNRRVVTVDLKKDTLLLINSNWNEHFHTDLGKITKVAGRLAVDLSGLSGRQVVTVFYRPRSFVLGAWVSMVSLPALIAGFVVLRRRRARGG